MQVGLLYNYLDENTKADVNGIKEAYVKVDSRKKIQAKPLEPETANFDKMYGASTTLIPDRYNPTALISKASPEDSIYPLYQEFGNKLLRAALRKIVDEV